MTTRAAPSHLTETLLSAATERGLSWFGVARAGELLTERERLGEWLGSGLHAGMTWMERDVERRTDPRRVVEGCRSVVVIGVNYLRGDVDETRTATGFGFIARYARLRDYHRVLERELRCLARVIEAHEPGVRSRAIVDSGPAVERAWAQRAGFGFIGKNTMLIHPQEGSFHVLGVLLTQADLVPSSPAPEVRGCGDCRRCIDSCPTGAIIEPWKLDSGRCLSYLTIEADAPPPEAVWPSYGGWVFGCDVCQEVCPYNRARARPAAESNPMGLPLVAGEMGLVDLLRITPQFLADFPVATPLRRAGADGLARNAAIVSVERGDRAELEALTEIVSDAARPAWLRALARRCADRMGGRLAGGGA